MKFEIEVNPSMIYFTAAKESSYSRLLEIILQFDGEYHFPRRQLTLHVDATIKNEIERVFRNFSSLLLETRSISGRRNAFAYNSVDKTIKHRLIFIGKF